MRTAQQQVPRRCRFRMIILNLVILAGLEFRCIMPHLRRRAVIQRFSENWLPSEMRVAPGRVRVSTRTVVHTIDYTIKFEQMHLPLQVIA